MLGNCLKTALLMIALLAAFGAAGVALAGPLGLLPALLAAAGVLVLAFRLSDALVLWLYETRELDTYTAPDLHAMLGELAQKAALPVPRLHLIEQDQPNAFAVGRGPEQAAIVVSSGIMRLLNSRELRAVLAYELALIRRRDVLVSTLTATLTGGVSLLAGLPGLLREDVQERKRTMHRALSLLVRLLAPLAAAPVHLLLWRNRVYAADAGGARLCGDPLALAQALDKIERYVRGSLLLPAEQHPTTAPLMIVNPLSGGPLAKLFATHPATPDRIARLETLFRAADEDGSAAPAGIQR